MMSGLNIRYKFSQQLVGYGQLALDEFVGKNLFAQNGLATASTLEFFPSPPSFNLFGLTIILITTAAGLDAGPVYPLVLYNFIGLICNG